MPAISYKKFTGEIPRMRPHLLPEQASQLCENVDLADGSLVPLRDGLLLRQMLSNPVRGIYTQDGINFYTWSVETLAFRSPIIDDSYNRFYFLQPSVGTFNVGTTLQMGINGPSPTSQVYRAGVPQPTVAPALSLINLNEYPEYPGATATASAWWESSGAEYGRNAVTLNMTSPLRQFVFSAPTKPTGTPDGSKLAMSFVYKDVNGQEIMSVTVRAGETTRSNALPGTVEFTLTETGATGTLRLDYGVAETRAYVYNFENEWGEEGAPSPPAQISPTYVQSVRVVCTNESFSGFVPRSKINIYRTFGTTATYLHAKVTTVNPTTFDDKATTPENVGDALPSTDWLPSPTGLAGIDITPNGWFVAFKGNMLHMSEPYRPHAWPYSVPFQSVIRGVRVSRSGVVVTTADGLYVLNGAFPSNAQPVKVDLPQPGVAQRSMVGVDGGVAYASQDGIVVVEGNAASLAAGAQLFTRKVWRERYGTALADASMTFGYHDGALVMTSKTIGAGFLVRLDEEVGQFTRTTGGYDAMFLLPVTDTLYYSIGSNVYRYNSGNPLTCDWWGRDFIFPQPVTFGAGRIECTGPVRLRLYANKVLVLDRTITSGYFRLENMLKQLTWSVRLTTQATVTEFAIARSMLDLKNV